MEVKEINKAVYSPAHYNDYDVECIEMMRRIWQKSSGILTS